MRSTSLHTLMFLCLIFIACSLGRKSEQPATNQANQSNQGNTSTTQQAQPSPNTQALPGSPNVGEAKGTYTARGETVELKYAYAGRANRFSEDSIVVLLTDKPIPPEAIAEEIKSVPLLEGEKIRGLEYAFLKDGNWVRYHPSQYQESNTKPLKEYIVENGIVRGFDEDTGETSNGKYSRSVRFAAALIKQ
jgi:hypothetical protein